MQNLFTDVLYLSIRVSSFIANLLLPNSPFAPSSMRIQSGITWFDDDDSINSTVSFPSESTWKLERKMQENEYYIPKDTAQINGLGSEARAVFIGSKLSGDGPQEAIIKIRMQYVSEPFLSPFG